MRHIIASLLAIMASFSLAEGRLQRRRTKDISKEVLEAIQMSRPQVMERSYDVWNESALQMSMSMSMGCPFTETERQLAIIDQIVPVTTPSLLVTPGTPQFQALTWLLLDDTLFICPGEGPCPEKAVDRFLMALLYYSTEGEDWTNCAAAETGSPCVTSSCNIGSERWLSGSDECDWCGLSCSNVKDVGPDPTGCGVTDIDIENINQSGVLPFELGAALELRQIRMENGSIEGTMPAQWGALSELRALDLNFQDLVGPIPASYYGLSNLNIMDLNDNMLTGTISEQIGDLTELEFFEVSNNNMDGPFPQAIGTLKNLEVLGMADNDFTGELPDSWETDMLDTVFLQNNNLSGDLEFLGNLPNYDTLFIMDFSRNEFTGTIPEEMEDAVNMFRLNFSFNQLTGAMPPGMASIDFDELSADCLPPPEVVCSFCTQCT